MMDLSTLASELYPALVEDFRRQGGRVIGYACAATPREVLDAAGALPYRIRALGNAERSRADALLSRFNCTFCRSCLQLHLDGAFAFLDGLVWSNGCDHLRGMFESWSVAPGQFGHYLRVPHLATPESVDVFTEDLELLLEALAAYVGRSITARDLRAAIALRRQAREALDRLLALRLDDPPRITGSEALAALLLEGTLPPAVLCELLQEATAEALQRRPSGPRLRLLLGGGVTDELQLVRELETLGGVVVADNLCHGSRILRGVPDEEQEPLRWLARSYLEELRCPRMFDAYPERLRWLRATAREARVDGAILVHNKFCDLHGVENARLRIDLEQEGVPVLVLEKEYGAVADLGRIRTRVQAFLERVSS